MSLTRLFFTAALICSGFSASPAVAAGPSFNCANATKPDEHAICGSDQLSELDQVVASGYSFLRATKGKSYARKLGVPLLRTRQACKSDYACIERRQIEAIRAYQQAGAMVSLPGWAAPSPKTPAPTPAPIVQQNTTNVLQQNITVVQHDLDKQAQSQSVLNELITMQQGMMASSGISALSYEVLLDLSQEIDQDINKLRNEARQKYHTSIKPNNASVDFSAREKSKLFPRVPYYVSGRVSNGEFWLEPVVVDSGELIHKMNFLDPKEKNERISSSFELTLDELEQLRAGLEKVYEWSKTAKERKIHKHFRKTAVCYPASMCSEKAIGNTSTQIDFLIYEDGATGARLVRNKGAFEEPYNMSIESAALLAAYLDYVKAAAQSEFEAGSMNEEKLDALFE